MNEIDKCKLCSKELNDGKYPFVGIGDFCSLEHAERYITMVLKPVMFNNEKEN